MQRCFSNHMEGGQSRLEHMVRQVGCQARMARDVKEHDAAAWEFKAPGAWVCG